MITNERIKTDLKTKDFWYDLPEELIAQHPSEVRDMARLMTVDRKTGGIGHHIFHDIVDMLNPGDVMVINDSKVIPARLYGTKVSEGHAHVEVVLLRQRSLDHWEALVNPGRRLKPGTSIVFGESENGEPLLTAEITEILEGGNRMLEFSYDHSKYTIYDILDKIGNMPLPPYITEKLEDKSRYQTVYAREEGSAAAPTAGLHFTPELLDRIREKGVAIAPVMLHVGLGTFRPVKEDAIGDHLMHSEFFSVTEESARVINERRAAGGRIVAVGTTSCRTLESASDDNGIVHPMQADTGIFIYPGYRFKAVDALVTNFHLPESTLLMLVSAFSSREIMLRAYEEAVRERYKFFSFGDAMFIS
ncbi:MAG: tRNA preQ1(34) S-adenosylmethionine ribosyltransferase-isomerase QueA [Clostridiales bacterium]|nr:tRNA preQ1(34) S-adenosylmethionine ribosyltransferase-isomerase QueA [Clostridiales bacterium]MDY4434496.1 tRNA preQ1(34) S-adenosylmethionine ribosyltransferase-isomerase QueA [Candidatus Flemingibacterium sp.]